jgi:cytochrome c oxidase assembly protein subunit 11
MSARAPMDRRNRRVVAICAAAALTMLGAAFAAVPLYDMFCRVTGYGGTTQVATAAPDAVLERTVTVRFDGSVADGAPLRFTPRDATMTVRLGERGLAYYEVRNLSDRPVTAVASYNVSPFKTGEYFNKIQCFCFTEQTFAPGEARELAVLFFVDPAMDGQKRLDDVREITLSYTFFRMPDGAADTLAARDAGAGAGG